MIINEKEKEVLLDPASNGADELIIFSGYSRASFVLQQLEKYRIKNLGIKVKLFIGMKGTGSREHLKYKGLMEIYNNFECFIYAGSPEVHSKVYLWNKNKNNYLAFLGSSNYSHNGFNEISQGNVLVNCDPLEANDYIEKLSTDCLTVDAYNPPKIVMKPKNVPIPKNLPNIDGKIFRSPDELEGLETYTISLLKKNGEMPKISGLNWGQRVVGGKPREPNQAYISIRVKEVSTEFIPPRGEYFIVFTDDGHEFFMTPAQDGRVVDGKQYGKAFHTPKVGTQDNSTLGLYFRKRLGLQSGEFVSKDDLINYGRTNINLTRIDEESYYLDFGVIGTPDIPRIR